MSGISTGDAQLRARHARCCAHARRRPASMRDTQPPCASCAQSSVMMSDAMYSARHVKICSHVRCATGAPRAARVIPHSRPVRPSTRSAHLDDATRVIILDVYCIEYVPADASAACHRSVMSTRRAYSCARGMRDAARMRAAAPPPLPSHHDPRPVHVQSSIMMPGVMCDGRGVDACSQHPLRDRCAPCCL